MSRGSIKEQRIHRRTVVLIVIAALVFVAVFTVKIMDARKENEELASERSRIEESLSEAIRESESIAERQNRELTDEEMVEIARKRFGLLFPNEILFLPKEE